MAASHHARTKSRQCSCSIQGPGGAEATALKGSVGQGGVNQQADVRNVQSRLNRVAPEDGGPEVPLDVDGICGTLTRQAILTFQKRHPELLKDGRIDVGKNTWKRLLALSDGEEVMSFSTSGPQPKKSSGGGKKAPTPPPDLTLPLAALTLSQYRIFEALKSLDVAMTELQGCQARSFLDINPSKASLFKAYQDLKPGLKELPTVDRVFHVISNDKVVFAKAQDSLQRLRKIYRAMLDVIVTTLFTTPKAEKNGSRRFVRVVPQAVLNSIHVGGAIADAPEQGWWFKNANLGHIRIGSAHVNDGDLITSMIHEMAHFVSHPSTYIVGGHVSGIYNKALDDTHAQAVRNAFCYEWYAFLASFKSQRSTPNQSLVLI